MKNKTLSIATLLLTGALLFAGCGQTGNTTGNTSSTTAGQETATTEMVIKWIPLFLPKTK